MDTLVPCETLRKSQRNDFSEAEAIRRAQQGDAEGFERLYKLHSRRVYGLCLRMMKGNASEAEDLTQEAFLHLFRKIGTFRAESAFSTWLHRVTFNIVLMRLRKKTVAEMMSLEETIATGLCQQLARLTVELGIHQHGCLRGIPIVQIVRGELEIPAQLAGSCLQRHHGTGVEVVALALVAVVVGTWIAGWPID